MLSGMVTLVSALNANQPSPMDVRESESVMLDKELPLKALRPIVVTLLGMLMLINELNPNATSPIDVTLLGIVKLGRALKANA